MEQQTPNINRAIMLAVVDEAIEWYVGHPEHYAFDEFDASFRDRCAACLPEQWLSVRINIWSPCLEC